MLVLFVLLAVAPGQAQPCRLAHAAAPNEAAARRIAEATIRGQPTLRPVTDAAAAGRPYRLVVEPDQEDAGQWSAFQMPPGRQMGGGGLEFRIDRCTGAISRMHYSR